MKSRTLFSILYVSIFIVFSLLSLHIVTWTNEGVTSNVEKRKIIEKSSLQEKVREYPYLDLDLSSAISMNADTIGWIQIPNTNVDYPVLQASDNDYYLNHSFSKEENSAGWVFLDSRNQLTDQRLILYAHNRLDGTMFGSLIRLYEEESSGYFYFNTINEKMTFQIVSIYTISESEFWNTREVTSSFVQDIQSRNQTSIFEDVLEDDMILSLYTCYGYGDERLIVHAKRVQVVSSDLL